MDCTHFSIALQQTSFFFFFSFFYRIISSLSRHSIPHKLQQIIKLATFAWNCKTFSRPQPSSRNTFSRAFESSLPGTKTRTQHILPVVSCLHNHLQNINAPACTTTNLGHPARDWPTVTLHSYKCLKDVRPGLSMYPRRSLHMTTTVLLWYCILWVTISPRLSKCPPPHNYVTYMRSKCIQRDAKVSKQKSTKQ